MGDTVQSAPQQNGDDTDDHRRSRVYMTGLGWEMYALFEGLIIDADGGMDSPTFATKRPLYRR